MNHFSPTLLSSSLFFLLACVALGTPIETSWLTEPSGQYARIYPSYEAEAAIDSVTSWIHPNGGNSQLSPTYAGVHEISGTATDLYIRTSGMGFHVMGPWYGGNGGIFNSYPGNTASTARFPRTPVVAALPKTLTPGGSIGYMVDGIAMFDSRDANSFVVATGADSTPNGPRGDGFWNRDAYVNESITFDPANAHPAGAQLHYHANTPALRHLLGGSVDYDAASNTYTEAPNGEHSPIIAWVYDGVPLYGPYGYSNPSDPNSGVRRMISGYQMRDGSNGSTDLRVTGRTTFPEWLTRNQANRSNPPPAAEQGPNVAGVFVLGRYLEDNAYKGDLGMTLGTDFDLNEYNVRFCVTPEFPDGTWAYFTCIAANGTPVFPYNISRYYFGEPDGQRDAPLPVDRDILFQGGPEARPVIDIVDDLPSPGDITLLWSGPEGGTYQIDHSENLAEWELLDDSAHPELATFGSAVDQGRCFTDFRHFYRHNLSYLENFDDNGFDYPGTTPPTFAATLDPLPPIGEITSVTIGGLPAEFRLWPDGSLALDFDEFALAPGDYTATINYTPAAGTPTQVQSTNLFTVDPPNNILLMIVDDWGIDSSSLYATENASPGNTYPPMPNLDALAARGLRFANAYANPVCSPTRASMITGRHAFRHGIGTPNGANLPTTELALPEVFAAQNSDYNLASIGKWHLGGGDNGPGTLGGWPEFRGSIAGISDYESWDKTVNGSTSLETTYATTDQVDETLDYIAAQGNDPWFVWLAFHAPHSPFHNPPAQLHDYPTYPVNAAGEVTGQNRRGAYEAALQALDTEIGRLLASVDLERTNILLLGDNGTPAPLIQGPYTAAHAKDTLYQGGVHVPFVAAGPDVRVTGTSQRPVHCTDLFATVLELARIRVDTATATVDVLDSRSLVPILKGRESMDRTVVTERFSGTAADGRAILSAAHPGYKLISFGDPRTPVVPTYELYALPSDEAEAIPLALPPVYGDAHRAAYEAFVAIDESLRPVVPAGPILYLHLPEGAGPQSVPNNANLEPTSIDIDGVAATFLNRFDTTDVYNQFWVKCQMPVAGGAPYTTATVTFPENPNNPAGPRVFVADQIVE